MAKSVKYTVNFLEAKEGDLHRYRWRPGLPSRPSCAGVRASGSPGHSATPGHVGGTPGPAPS